MGPGIIAAVAYFDPGNWSVDLQAGSQYGYKLLFVVLVAGLGAIVLQVSPAPFTEAFSLRDPQTDVNTLCVMNERSWRVD
jgi:hypothetical protein